MKTGTVVNCLVANVHSKTSEVSEILDTLECLSEVEILNDYKFEDLKPVKTKFGVYFEPKDNAYVRVKTDAGIVGYMNKKYLAIKEDSK